MTTPILGLTELSNTSGERSTLVDSYRILDGMWGKTPAVNININTPPVSPNEGDSALISSAPTGDFAGFPGHIALYIGTGWHFVPPDKIGFVQTESGPHEPNGTLDGWTALTLPAGSVLTTKGDLLAFGTADTRLPVGTDGQALVADSTEALGVKWDTISGSGGGSLEIEDNGTSLTTAATKINFINGAVSSPLADEIEVDLSTGGIVTSEQVLTGDITLSSASPNRWFLDGGSSDRDVILSLPSDSEIQIFNTGTTNNLAIVGTATLATLTPNDWLQVTQGASTSYVTAVGTFISNTTAAAPPAILTSATYHTSGENTVNDGTKVSALTNLGTGTFTISQADVNKQPLFVAGAFGSIDGWQAVDTGNNSTRDSFDISPALTLPGTGWTVMVVGNIANGSIILSSSGTNDAIRIPNGGAITVTRNNVNTNSSPLANAFPFSYVWTVTYTGTTYEFYEGLTARGSGVTSSIPSFNRVGEISGGITRNDCTMGETVVFDAPLSTVDRVAMINYLAGKYGITL